MFVFLYSLFPSLHIIYVHDQVLLLFYGVYCYMICFLYFPQGIHKPDVESAEAAILQGAQRLKSGQMEKWPGTECCKKK